MKPTDAEVAKPFVDATKHVLTMMAQLDPKPGKPYVKKVSAAAGDVSAVVGLTGDNSLPAVPKLHPNPNGPGRDAIAVKLELAPDFVPTPALLPALADGAK